MTDPDSSRPPLTREHYRWLATASDEAHWLHVRRAGPHFIGLIYTQYAGEVLVLELRIDRSREEVNQWYKQAVKERPWMAFQPFDS